MRMGFLAAAIQTNFLAFVDNLRYMALGMLGIFVVIGLLILVTMVLNRATKDDAGGNAGS